MRVMTICHSAELAWRSPPRLRRWRICLPEEASTGLAPHSAAKLASVRSRLGLSPTVTSSVLADWVAAPFLARNWLGAVWVTSSASAASSWAIGSGERDGPAGRDGRTEHFWDTEVRLL